MSRYIDADIAKEKLKEYCVDNDSAIQYWYDLMGIDECIDYNVPTADVRENVRGEWIAHELGGHHHKTILWGHDCSICGHWIVVGEEKIKEYNFCPNCGADMRGDNNGKRNDS